MTDDVTDRPTSDVSDSVSDPGREALIRRIADYSWFHAIDFGDSQTPGRAPSSPPNWSLFGSLHYLANIDLTGMRCLDIGTMDGLAAFIMSRGGAKEVIATDLYERDSFRLARELARLEDEVSYHPFTHLNAMEELFGAYSFDVIVFSGVLYHVFSPLVSLMQCRRLLKEDGLLLVETACTPGTKPQLLFNMEATPPLFDEYTTYFVPSTSAVEGMMKFAGLDVIGSAQLADKNRVTTLARAARPSEINDRSSLMRDCHERLSQDRKDLLPDALNFWELENQRRQRSTVSYTGSAPRPTIDTQRFETALPFQPSLDPAPREWGLSRVVNKLRRMARGLRPRA